MANVEPSYILLVEDEVLVRMLLADHLREEGFRVIEAADADEALVLLEEKVGVRAVITDVRMPGLLDGLALAELIAPRWPDVKVFITSGYLGSACPSIPPAATFIPKPYQPEDVTSLLRSELG